MSEIGISTQKVNILMVDDHPENLLALQAILSDPSYNLVTATTGPEALKKILRQDFALVLLDVMMPGMDGYEVAAMIKQREASRHLPIIFLTAVARDMDHVFRGYSVGAVDYLTKPLETHVVRAKVAVFVDLYRKKKQIQEQAALLREKERQEKEFELAELKRREEEKYRNLAESVPEIVMYASPEGGVQYVNSRWYSYTGLSHGESMGKEGMQKIIHPEDRERHRTMHEKALREKRPYELEVRLERYDGQYRWHLCRNAPQLDAQGNVIAWLGTKTDIEEQKQNEMKLQDAVKSRDEFFSIASHELKTPITSLKLQIQLLERNLLKNIHEPADPRKILDRLGMARSQTVRLERLIENLLDISLIRHNRLSVDIEKDVDLTSIVKDVVGRLSEDARIASCTIELDAEENVSGDWDRIRLEQVTTNLISNAIKYGKGAPIKVKLWRQNGDTLLSVRDFGIGISKEDQARIFDAFERAVSSKHFSGLGLGLYITQQIVRAHGGDLRVESEPTMGSCFTVCLPTDKKVQPLAPYQEKALERRSS